MRIKKGEAAEMIVLALTGDVFGKQNDDREECKKAMKGIIAEGIKVERSPQARGALEKALKGLDL